MRDRERAVAADDDQRVEAHLVEHLDARVGVVAGAFGRRDRIGERVAAVGRAEDGAAEPQDAGDVAGRQHAGAVRSIRPSKLSSRPTHSMPALAPT